MSPKLWRCRRKSALARDQTEYSPPVKATLSALPNLDAPAWGFLSDLAAGLSSLSPTDHRHFLCPPIHPPFPPFPQSPPHLVGMGVTEGYFSMGSSPSTSCSISSFSSPTYLAAAYSAESSAFRTLLALVLVPQNLDGGRLATRSVAGRGGSFCSPIAGYCKGPYLSMVPGL